jgi:hypothetical protein
MRAVRGLLRAQARACQRRLRRADGGGGGLPCSPPGAPGRHRGTGPRREPGPDEWRVAYEALQQSARSLLRRSRSAPGGRDDDLLSPAETVIVRRCQDCGGVDAPQPCIDVCIWGPCIWGPADWVDATSYESERSRAAFDLEVEQSLAGLLRRLAFATPRDGQWERSWRAFQSQAHLAFQSRGSRRVANEMAIRQAQADG